MNDFDRYALIIAREHTSTRRQRTAAKSKIPANSSTACFGFDTPVLIISQGIAQWENFYKVEKGVSVVQSLPSGNTTDLTDAIITPIKTLCCFETQKGDNDMVKMGKCSITPLHHILEGWMKARQAAARGQGKVFRSKAERVYNIYLEGGGNIIINASRQLGSVTLNGSYHGLSLYTNS